jgi:hypothetical protein
MGLMGCHGSGSWEDSRDRIYFVSWFCFRFLECFGGCPVQMNYCYEKKKNLVIWDIQKFLTGFEPREMQYFKRDSNKSFKLLSINFIDKLQLIHKKIIATSAALSLKRQSTHAK